MKDEPLELITPYEALPALLVITLTATPVVGEIMVVVVVPVATVVAAAAAAAASVGSLETVLVMIIGSYPGAETVPPLTTDTGAAGVAAAVPVELD